MNIIFLDQSTVDLNDIDFSPLQQLGTYAEYPSSTEDQIIERARDAEVVIANKAPMTKRVLESLPKLKLITVIATGYNNVDIPAARSAGVTVCNVAGYAAKTVPQHVFALILNLATQAYRYHQDILDGKWQSAPIFTLLTYPTFELAGKTIGIVGFGAIGREVAKIAEGFGMKVLAHNSSPIKNPKYSNTDLDQLLRESDIVTLHVPLNERTRHLIDAQSLAKMKKSAILINTARGGVVDEQALADALNTGRIAGAGTDVLSQEPPKNGNPLIGAKNMILTPHSAWSTREARQRLVEETAENIRCFTQGRPRNVVS